MPVNKSVNLKDCTSAKADGVIDAIKGITDEINDTWKQKTGLMIGKSNSVFAELKRDVPNLVSIRCFARELELGFQDTIEGAKEMLEGIWKHYKYSWKAVCEWKELEELIDERVYKAVKADGWR